MSFTDYHEHFGLRLLLLPLLRPGAEHTRSLFNGGRGPGSSAGGVGLRGGGYCGASGNSRPDAHFFRFCPFRASESPYFAVRAWPVPGRATCRGWKREPLWRLTAPTTQAGARVAAFSALWLQGRKASFGAVGRPLDFAFTLSLLLNCSQRLITLSGQPSKLGQSSRFHCPSGHSSLPAFCMSDT